MMRDLVEDVIREPCLLVSFPLEFTHEVIARVYGRCLDLFLGPRREGPYF